MRTKTEWYRKGGGRVIESFTIGDGINVEIDIVPSRGVLRRWYWMVRTLDAKVMLPDPDASKYDVFWHRRAEGYAWTFRGACRKAENVVCDIEQAIEVTVTAREVAKGEGRRG